MVFFVTDAAVNLTWRGDPEDPAQDPVQNGQARDFDGSCGSVVWRSEPRRYVHSFQDPAGWAIKNGEPKPGLDLTEHFGDFCHDLCRAKPALTDYLRQLREKKKAEDERFQGLIKRWKDVKPLISFDRWRSGEVRAIREAWQKAGCGAAPFDQKEHWYAQHQAENVGS